MLFLKRCWDWCVKHWKLLLVSISGFIAFLIGYTRASRETQRVKLQLDLQNKDNKLLADNHDQQLALTQQAIDDMEKAQAELNKKKSAALESIDNKKEETKKEILNSDEKLNKILQDKWGLTRE